MRTGEVLSLAGEVLLIAALTGVLLYALQVLAGPRGWLRTLVLTLGVMYGVVVGLGVVVMELVVR